MQHGQRKTSNRRNSIWGQWNGGLSGAEQSGADKIIGRRESIKTKKQTKLQEIESSYKTRKTSLWYDFLKIERIYHTAQQNITKYPWLKEVDSLALANVQLHLEKAYKNFFANPPFGFPKFKSRHRRRKSYTTNVVNGNIRLENGKIRFPKLISHRNRSMGRRWLIPSRQRCKVWLPSLSWDWKSLRRLSLLFCLPSFP